MPGWCLWYCDTCCGYFDRPETWTRHDAHRTFEWGKLCRGIAVAGAGRSAVQAAYAIGGRDAVKDMEAHVD